MIAQIWAKLIKPKNPIAREDNFFELGGHSLLALEAIHRIENATGKRITTGDIVRGTLAEIAAKIDAASLGKDESETGPVALPIAAVRGLSPEQRRLLKRQLVRPGSVCNNVPLSWLIEGDLDIAIFSKSLVRVYERQTALRTVIQAHEGDYRQALIHVNVITLPEYEDCSNSHEPLEDALKKAGQMAQQPFSPLSGLLCRCKLFKLGDQRHLFVFVSHLLIVDGWSIDIFLRELESAYLAFSENRSPSTNPLAIEFRDYAQWCSSRNVSRDHVDYHLHAMEEISKSAFVNDGQGKGTCQRLVCRFPVTNLDQLERFIEKHKLRLHEFFFAVFAKVLADYIKKSKILIGVPVTGRYNPDVIGLIGCFVSVLPCEVRLEGSNFNDIATNVAGQLKEFHQHQDISYAEIIRGTSFEQQIFPSHMPASFSYQDIRNRPNTLAGLKLSQISIPRLETEIPIEFWTRIQPDGFITVFDYDSAMVDKNVVESLGDKITRMIQNLERLEVELTLTPTVDRVQPLIKKPSWRRLFQ